MRTLTSKIIAALILVAALAGLAGCAATGTQETATEWLDHMSQQSGGI